MVQKIIIFGVFDGLHDGHRFFISEALKLGEQLVVVLAPDSVVKLHKGRPPKRSFANRYADLLSLFPQIRIREGDSVPSSWNILREEEPDMIVLGYDQKALREALQDFYANQENPPALFLIPDHRGDELHSSLLS